MRPENGAQPENPTATPAAAAARAPSAPAQPGAARKVPISEVAVAFEDWDEAPVGDGELAELFITLEKAIRARRLYQENNPVYQQFVTSSRAAFARLWDRLPSLTVSVAEHAFHGFGKDFPSKEGREGLPFLFYRDGVRVVTFLPGFEDEIDRFLALIDHARQMGPRAADDIVTLLWEEEFSAFQYSYIDLLAEGTSIQPDRSHQPDEVERQRLERELAGTEPEPVPPAVEAGQPPVPQVVSMGDFNETTYFLENEEVEALYREVDAEWNRDVRSAVLDALFDRLEDETLEDRHAEIVRILGQLLPAFLARGDLSNVSKILTEIGTLSQAGTIAAATQEEIDRLLSELNQAQILSQFFGAIEDGTIDPTDKELALFLSYLGAEALPLLIRTAEKTESTRLRERMATALEDVGRKHGRALAALIGSEDMVAATGAARVAGRIRLRAAANNLIALFNRSNEIGRRIAIEALAGVGDAAALDAVHEALDDEDREVRIAAARGLASTRSPATRERLRRIIRSRDLRAADLTEKMAVFEAFGGVAEPGDVGLLDRILNGRKIIGRETPETRACAALALGLIEGAEAKSRLMAAARDQHPMVRNAVSRALSRRRTV